MDERPVGGQLLAETDSMIVLKPPKSLITKAICTLNS